MARSMISISTRWPEPDSTVTLVVMLTSALDVRNYIRNSSVSSLLHWIAAVIYGVIACSADLIAYIGRESSGIGRRGGEARGKRCRAA